MAAMDPLEICPLDPAHQILKSRMQFHLVRCMKNHNLQDKMICPYNSVHIVDKIVFQDHVATCPDFREVQAFKYQTDDKELNGILTLDQISQAHAPSIPGEENWDDGIVHPSYDPMKNSEGKPLVRTLIGASKAKRRDFRMRERERMAQFADATPTPTQPDEVDKKAESMAPLRAPRSTFIGEPKPLRPPRNLQTPSTGEEVKGSLLPKTILRPVAEENAAGTKDTATSEKVKMPKRKPNLHSQAAAQESKTDEEKMKSYSGALKHDNPQEDHENVTHSTPQPDINSNIREQLMELEEITKKANAEKERLMKLLKAPNKQASDQSKKIGRCAAKFA